MGDPSGLEHGGCRLSPGFANLVRNIEERYGYHLRVIPTREWLVYGSSQDHLLAALAFYETWKNKQKDQPVNLSLMDEEGLRYISISDAASGPSLTAYHSEEIKQERHAVWVASPGALRPAFRLWVFLGGLNSLLLSLGDTEGWTVCRQISVELS